MQVCVVPRRREVVLARLIAVLLAMISLLWEPFHCYFITFMPSSSLITLDSGEVASPLLLLVS